MQASSFFNPKGASLTAPHLDSATDPSFILRSGRRKKSPFRDSRCSHGFRNQNQSLRHGFLSYGLRLGVYAPKMRSFGRSLALASPMEQTALVCGNVKSQDESSVDDRVAEPKVVEKSKDAESAEEERVDVRALGLRLCDAKTADDVEEVLKSMGELPLPVYSSIIRAFGFDKKLKPAFALVEWMKRNKQESNGALGPNLFIYNSLLGAVKQTKQFEKIDEVIKEMKSEGILPNIVTYNTLMSVHLDQGKAEEALSVLDDIELIGLSPSPVTYSTVLLAYREMEDAKGAIEFFVKLREKYEKGEMVKDNDYDWDDEFVKLENFTVRICYLLMRHFLAKGDDSSTNVFKVLSVMDNHRIRLGREECERLIWACTREGHYTVAREMYSRIREMGDDISLSVCNHVIWLMGKAKKWWAALEIYEDLLDKGPKPNNLSYELIISHFNILLTAARRKGIWRWGVRLINKMLEKGLKPGTREWNAVLVACSKASETSVAVEIFRRMVDHGEKPTVVSYGALLSALEKGKLYDEALRVWEHMNKVGVKPNLHAYTILASIYIGMGKHQMVDSVLKEMKEAKIEPNVVTFNAIITGCAKNNMGGAAFEWFHCMKVQGITPNDITYDMLIEALARDGKPRLAYDMYLRAQNEGLHPSPRSYDAIVESCRVYNTNLNLDALGARPVERHKLLQIQKEMSEFDTHRRGKPFEKTGLHTSQMQER